MKFFVIEKRPKSNQFTEEYRTDFTYDDSVAKQDAPVCSVCGSFVGMLRAAPPFRVHLESWGRDYGDLAFGLSDFLVSGRFRDEFLSSGLCGLSGFDAVECLSSKSHGSAVKATPAYFRVVPTVGGARIDTIESKVEWCKGREPSCQVCLSNGLLKRWKSVSIDDGSWSGDDVFYPYGLPGVLVASERFVEWSSECTFRNLIFRPASSVSHDFYPWLKAPA